MDLPDETRVPADLGSPPPPAHRTRRRARWAAAGWVALVLVIALIWAAQLIHIDYYTEAPGDAVPVQPLVEIDGGPEFESDGSFMLLYIRRRDRISLLRYIQARLDSDIDVERGDYDEPFQSPADLDAMSQSDMTRAQFAARKLALERIGESVEILDGLVVTSVVSGRPAADVLRPGDVILAVDGHEVPPGDPDNVVTTTIRSHKIGEAVDVTFERRGEEQTVAIKTESNGVVDDEQPLIGVLADVRYEYPFDIEFGGEIEGIGGPSAGLAMTLALLDELTPGELTGGGDVAVTGTIDVDGSVGNVGRVDLKAKAAADRGATLMLVPMCPDPGDEKDYERPSDYKAMVDFAASCEAEVVRADAEIETVVEVATLDEALAALVAHGGDPVPVVTTRETTGT